MPAINVLIKPASSACNMHCRYCFYQDVASLRDKTFKGMLSLEMMEKIIISAMEFAEGWCTFAFQGGEPTLAGLDFFESVIELQKKHAKAGVRIQNTIQTNGILLDEKWVAFFARNQFLVGVSLDGSAELHDANRKDTAGKGTFSRIMHGIQL